MERGAFVLSEITSALEFLFDDGIENEDDAALAATKAAHADDPSTADALALALDDYAALAASHKKELEGLGGFDAALIGEAHAIARPSCIPRANVFAGRACGADRTQRLSPLARRANSTRAQRRAVRLPCRPGDRP